MIVRRTSKPTVYVMLGIPGSGKSTWTQKNLPDLPVVSRDLIRVDLGYCRPEEKYRGTEQEEAEVSRIHQELCERYIRQKKDFVVDDTNLNSYTPDLISRLEKLGGRVVGVKFHTPLHVCIRRREGQVPEKVLRGMYERINDFDGLFEDIINVGL